MFSSCKNTPNKASDSIRIDKIYIYSDFEERGYTTASAYTHFDDLKIQETGMVLLEVNDKRRLEQILNNSEQKIHKQTKMGGGLIFCKINYNNAFRFSDARVVISVGNEKSYIIDLTNTITYKIISLSDIQWLQNFAARIKQ